MIRTILEDSGTVETSINAVLFIAVIVAVSFIIVPSYLAPMPRCVNIQGFPVPSSMAGQPLIECWNPTIGPIFAFGRISEIKAANYGGAEFDEST